MHEPDCARAALRKNVEELRISFTKCHCPLLRFMYQRKYNKDTLYMPHNTRLS